MILCRCCIDHPHEAQVACDPVRCVECGEMCQCEGCFAEIAMPAAVEAFNMAESEL